VVAPSVSGCRHEDLLASRHGHVDWESLRSSPQHCTLLGRVEEPLAVLAY
jgi:hypothetical protein